jgi:hypothetical protein
MKAFVPPWLFELLFLLPSQAGEPKRPAYLEGLTALTDGRIPMNPAVSTRCSIDAILNGNPHQRADMVIYGNKILLDYIKAEPKGLAFPMRSVLLKEKYPPGEAKAEATLITRMERTATKGEIGDWKFSVQALDDSGTWGDQEALSRCQTCHEDYEDTSFVSKKSVELLQAFVGRDAKPVAQP